MPRPFFLSCLLLLMTGLLPSLQAGILVDGSFGSPFGDDGWDASPFGGVVQSSGLSTYDAGWFTYDHSTGATYSPAWEVSGGAASRTANTQFQFGGLAQMVSNPGDGSFDNGDLITFSFDYLMNASPTGALAAGVWGVTAPNGTAATWNLFAGESLNGLGQSGTAIGATDFTSGTDYQFSNLAYFEDTTQSAGAAFHSVDFTLTQDYDFFVVAFQADPDGDGAGVITLDNVSLATASVVPEPSALGVLTLLLAALGLMGRRRKAS